MASGNGDDCVWVHVVDMLAWQKTVQGCVDGGGTRVQIESGMRVHRDHVVFRLALVAFVWPGRVQLLQIEQLLLVQRGKVLSRGSPEIATGAFDPKYFCRVSGERIAFGDLGRGVPATGVGDALVGAQ